MWDVPLSNQASIRYKHENKIYGIHKMLVSKLRPHMLCDCLQRVNFYSFFLLRFVKYIGILWIRGKTRWEKRSGGKNFWREATVWIIIKQFSRCIDLYLLKILAFGNRCHFCLTWCSLSWIFNRIEYSIQTHHIVRPPKKRYEKCDKKEVKCRWVSKTTPLGFKWKQSRQSFFSS